MKIDERDNLVQTYKNQITTLEKQWYETRDPAVMALSIKAREELRKVQDTSIDPEVGMGATGGFGSDCYPFTVVWVSADKKKIEVTHDTHTPAPGCDYYTNQIFNYTSNMNGHRERYRLRKMAGG